MRGEIQAEAVIAGGILTFIWRVRRLNQAISQIESILGEAAAGAS